MTEAEHELYKLLIEKYPLECNSFNAQRPPIAHNTDYLIKLTIFILRRNNYVT